MTIDTNQLIASLSQEATPMKAVRLRVLCGRWVAGFVLYTALLVSISGTRPDLMVTLTHPLFALEILLLIGLIVSAALAAAVLSYPDRHQYRWILFLPGTLMIAFAAVLACAWLTSPPHQPAPNHGLECLTCISFYALIPAAWMFWHMRKLASTQPGLAGGATVVAAFSIGALALRLNEATDSIPHVVQWHYIPMLVVAILGAKLGKWLLKW